MKLKDYIIFVATVNLVVLAIDLLAMKTALSGLDGEIQTKVEHAGLWKNSFNCYNTLTAKGPMEVCTRLVPFEEAKVKYSGGKE